MFETRGWRKPKYLMNTRNPIKGFTDLEVYQNRYTASIEVITKVVPELPNRVAKASCLGRSQDPADKP
jgi:hypothetical protein